MPNPTFVYLDWRGRISRKTYWLFGLLPAALYLILHYGLPDLHGLPFWLLLLASFVPSMMINIKRSHDRGKTGWFTLLLFVPLLNIWPVIELGFFPGTEGDNRYGPPALW